MGLAFYDEDLRCLRINAALEKMTGVPAAQHLGRRPAEVLPELGHRLGEVLAATLRSASPRSDVGISGRLPSDPGTLRHWLASTYAIAGTPARVGIVVVDITHRKRIENERGRLLLMAREARDRAEIAEHRAAFLASAGTALSESLDLRETLDRIARLAVPELADWCFVELLQDDGSIKRVAWAADEPAHDAILASFDERFPLDPDAPYGSPQVIRTGEPMLEERVLSEQLETLAQNPEHLATLRSLGFGAAVVVPLRARGRILGDIAMVCGASGRRVDAEDLELAQGLADRCALAVDNALLFARRDS